MKRITGFKSLVLVVVLMSVLAACSARTAESTPDIGKNYYIDSGSGDDNNNGTGENTPWETLDKVSGIIFQPGDNIYFERGSSYEGSVYKF